PLSQALLETDQVAIVLHNDVPRPIQVASGILKAFKNQGFSKENLTFVLSQKNSEVEGFLKEEGVACTVHDPGDENKNAFLGALTEGDGIYLMRALCEADFILPVLPFAEEGVLSWEYGLALLPEFADETFAEHFSSKNKKGRSVEIAWQREELKNSENLLNVLYALWVMPTDDQSGRIADQEDGPHFVCTDRYSAQKLAKEIFTKRKEVPSGRQPGDLDLIVLSLGEVTHATTWRRVVELLQKYKKWLAHEGTIVLCADLQEGVEKLPNKTTWEKYCFSMIQKELHRFVKKNHLYLYAPELNIDEIEAIGGVAIEDAAGLERLLVAHPNSLLLEV
ncbi:MAG: hypothetical protein MPJ24_11235, partial [Pirellulaceae bacterium]|nr:hypothetical protein [Pirellulaceae bacterium]